MTAHNTHVIQLVVISGNQHAHCRTCEKFLTVRDLLETIKASQADRTRPDGIAWDDTTILGLGPSEQPGGSER